MLATTLLIGLVLVAAVTDATRHRIYNWTTYPGIIAGLLLTVGGVLWEAIAPESAAVWQPIVGWLPWNDALRGFVACGALMTACFVLFGAGGGDVKLLAMIGCLTGLERGLQVLLWTFLFAGCVGLFVLGWRIGVARVARRAFQLGFSALSLGTVLRLPAEEKRILALPVVLAPCVPLALLVTFVQWPILF
jgi:Flp pilus assembly protein protease CpaA